MKTYLIPVDFTSTSDHAAKYAAELSNQTDVKSLILLNSFYVSVYESTLPRPDLTMPSEQEIEQEVADRTAKQAALKADLDKLAKDGVKITTELSREPLVRSVLDAIETHHADIVLLGGNGNETDSNSHIGNNIVEISKTSPVPVIVVPLCAKFTGVTRMLMAVDFQKVKENVPIIELRRLLNREELELLVVNVDPDGRHANADPAQLAEEGALQKMIGKYNPQYFYLDTNDIIKGVIGFAEQHKADLIIALPHKYSFLRSLVHSSVAHKLHVNSTVPVLLLK